jgi:hypothetical protein
MHRIDTYSLLLRRTTEGYCGGMEGGMKGNGTEWVPWVPACRSDGNATFEPPYQNDGKCEPAHKFVSDQLCVYFNTFIRSNQADDGAEGYAWRTAVCQIETVMMKIQDGQIKNLEVDSEPHPSGKVIAFCFC